MPEYDDNNRGVLFKNDKKEKDTHPDYKGSCEIDGVEMWMSVWIKTSKKGTKFMSLSFEPKEGQVPHSQRSGAGSDIPASTADLGNAAGVSADDDIPF